MIGYNADLAPEPFGLSNTGVICYFNAFLQSLSSCTVFIETVLRNEELLNTNTGRAMFKFIRDVNRGEPVSHHSSVVLAALKADLRRRRPNVMFGDNQESASEALVHILEMMIPEDAPQFNEITNLFLHRYVCYTHCEHCKSVVSREKDLAFNFNMFQSPPPTDANSFSLALRVHKSVTEDYKCEKCPCMHCGSGISDGKCSACGKPQRKTTAVRVYKLAMVPEIVFCMFNIYKTRIERFIPTDFGIPTRDGRKQHMYRMVGQIEHSGSLHGGHYWARGLRSENRVFNLNDSGVSPSRFESTPGTYIAIYNYTETT